MAIVAVAAEECGGFSYTIVISQRAQLPGWAERVVQQDGTRGREITASNAADP